MLHEHQVSQAMVGLMPASFTVGFCASIALSRHRHLQQ